MNINEEALKLHKEHKGKISVESKVPVKNRQDLSLAYTPGVAEPCRVIDKNPEAVYDYTSKGNMVAVVTDGSAVLGLGDIGPKAALPVMEGKAVLFKSFANVDAIPICLDTKDVEEIVMIVKNIAPSIGGVNLEDISAPRCFEIEDKLKKELDIPVFHDDQHGTAVVVLSGLLNALKVVGKKLEEVKIVASGAGAAGTAIVKLLISMGLKNVIMCDRNGAIYEGREEGMNWAKEEIAKVTNREKVKGSLADAIKGADVFIGVSAPGLVTQDMVKSMAKDPIIFAMANPIPEIMPDLAKEAGAKVICTGRSDFPNQVNNVLAFPGIFRGALDVRATDINEQMKIAAAKAIADLIPDEELKEDYVIADPFDVRVAKNIAKAVSKAAIDSGVARIK
jgi:malate dehydrogenase (oxaloacetate-decarboxylating)